VVSITFKSVLFGYVTSNSILLAAFIGFVLAFIWHWYRLRA
jgi:hypothetical protein